MALERLYDVGGRHVVFRTVEAVAAADATEKHVLFVAPTKCEVKAIHAIPDAAITGANTNTKHLNIDDEGSAGSGATEVANLDLTTGVNMTSRDVNTINSGLSVAMAKYDVLTVEVEQIGTGIALPIMTYMIEFEADDN